MIVGDPEADAFVPASPLPRAQDSLPGQHVLPMGGSLGSPAVVPPDGEFLGF
jgi:hypothetical protein